MKTFAAFIVALSLFSASAVHATTDAGRTAVALPAFPEIAEMSSALRLPGDPVQTRQPEQTAFIWFIIWAIHCADYPDDEDWC